MSTTANDPRIGFLLDGRRADMPLSAFARMIHEALPQSDEDRFFSALDAPPRQLEMSFTPKDATEEFPFDLMAQRMLALYRLLLSMRGSAPVATGPTLMRAAERAGIRFWHQHPSQALTDLVTDLCAAGCLVRPATRARAVSPVCGIDAVEKIREFRKRDKIRMRH